MLEQSSQSNRITPEQKESETRKLMVAADTNGDGVVNWDEFKQWFIPTARKIQAQKRKAEQIKKQRRAQRAGRSASTKPREAADNAISSKLREQPASNPEVQLDDVAKQTIHG